MLKEYSGYKRIFIAAGYTDLRKGVDSLATIISLQFKLDPYDKNTLFLFCGKRCDRMKGLLWEGDGFLLLYKRFEIGSVKWPRSKEEAMEVSKDQFLMLMRGFEIVARHPIMELEKSPVAM